MKEVAVRRHDGVSSDGHLAHVFRHAAKELFGEHVEEITYRALRFEPAYPQLVCRSDACGICAVCVLYLRSVVYMAALWENQHQIQQKDLVLCLSIDILVTF